MDDIFVARLMSTDPKTVTPDMLVEQAAKLMIDSDVGSVLVVEDDNQLAGILTRTDFVHIVAGQKPKDQTPILAYMSDTPVTISAQASVADAADLMVESGVHHLPVVDDDAGLIGIVTTTDLAAHIAGLDRSVPA
ncbi:CBS domain-containing protein [Halosegnis rubeus]|jgi:CBS domain-containing protein|uniref:CBS domain-containing protein n=1 Tax=Halosegnis rubeus TaxID=2212850 RepID=A0A5N5UMJ6_9EURY|nr:CBS domain-containing protein [Halosegnis rubeus]KAB7516059.1 CBS domain-containing protein [Halosegnis rubeus]KAB7516728.1 CBS domain-containing protein [Halosegnis rubeus]KAB7520141.1 CBS domain-containing protein [Halosegnis rubeus]